MKNNDRALYIVLLIAFLIRIALFLTQEGVLWPDSITYLNWATKIAEDFHYSSHPSYRTPIYPSFLAFFIWGFPEILAGKLILATQYILGIFGTFFIYKALIQVFSVRVSLLAALLFSINPLELYYETVIQTEALFVPMFSLVLFLSLRFIDVGSSRLAILLGLSLGVLSLTRPIAQMLLVLVLLLAYFSLYKKRKIIKPTLLTVAVYCLTIYPWLSVNYTHYGYWGISKDFGLNLFHRTFDVDGFTIESSKNDSFHRLAMREKEKEHDAYFFILSKLRNKGVSYNEIDRQMQNYGLELISHNFPQYVFASLRVFLRYLFLPDNSVKFCNVGSFAYLCSPNEQVLFSNIFPQKPIEENFQKLRLVIFHYFKLWKYFDIFLTSLAIFGGYSFLKSRKNYDFKLYLIIGIVLYFALIISFLSSAEDRYRLPIVPLLLPFAIYASNNLKFSFKKVLSKRDYSVF